MQIVEDIMDIPIETRCERSDALLGPIHYLVEQFHSPVGEYLAETGAVFEVDNMRHLITGLPAFSALNRRSLRSLVGNADRQYRDR